MEFTLCRRLFGVAKLSSCQYHVNFLLGSASNHPRVLLHGHSMSINLALVGYVGTKKSSMNCSACSRHSVTVMPIRKLLLSHFNCGKNGTDGDNPESPSLKLPRRLVKRLQKQGIQEKEFIDKLDLRSSSSMCTTGTRPGESSSEDKLKDILENMHVGPRHVSEDTDNFPSDMIAYKKWEMKDASSKTARPIVDPSATSVVLFPGQGSQFVGMGKKLLGLPGVKALYDEASSILGYDLLNLCLNGPKSDLDKTIHCQPAVMVTSLAAIEKLREEHPQAVEACVATAGFSVGELAALVFSGVLSFPDAVDIVKVRSEAMQRASEKEASGMMTVFLAHDSNLQLAMKTAKEYCIQRRGIYNPICTVANYIFPECKVIAGHEPALEFIATNSKEFKLLRTKRLPVSGAFHTRLMESAVKPLQHSLEHIQIGAPKINVFSNFTGMPYHPRSNISHKLGQQLVKPVKWEQIMHSIYTRDKGSNFPNTYELGPSKQMGTFLKQINLRAFEHYTNIDV